MAIDMKAFIADHFLDLCESKPMRSVTVKDILDRTGISRQTFYNHFHDKNDLIQWIFKSKIIPERELDAADEDQDYYDALLYSLRQMAKYHAFMKEACQMTSQNCPRDFVLDYAKEYIQKWYQAGYDNEAVSEELRFATESSMLATMSMTFSWILSDMPSTPEEMAKQLTRLRDVCLSKVLYRASADPCA